MLVDAVINYVGCFFNWIVGKKKIFRIGRTRILPVGFVAFKIWRNSFVGAMFDVLGVYEEIVI